MTRVRMRLHVHGDPDPAGDRARFEKALQDQCAKLDIDLDLAIGPEPPAIAVVFPEHGSAWREADEALHPALAAATHSVLPVIGVADDAKLLPKSLKAYNAFQTGLWGQDHWCAGMVDEVLGHAVLHRRERRVFLSYKRTDSEPVANQVYEALTRRGYVTFLDDVSIGKGIDFQRELKWWLNDADLLLVLLSPNFDRSAWCMEEIAFAQSRSVAVVVVDWPASVYASGQPFAGAPPVSKPPLLGGAIDQDQRMMLVDASFAPAPPAERDLWRRELTTEALHDVMAMCAQQRSLAIWRRVADLVPFAEEMLQAQPPLLPAGRPGDFTFSDKAGTTHFVRVLPHRPDARSVHDAWASAGSQEVVGCFYSECDPSDVRAAAMSWLADRTHAERGRKRHTRLWSFVGDQAVDQ